MQQNRQTSLASQNGRERALGEALTIQHLSQKQLAYRWQMSSRTLERWRRNGMGPRFLKLGGRCVYPEAEIAAFEASHLRERAVTRGQAADRPTGRGARS